MYSFQHFIIFYYFWITVFSQSPSCITPNGENATCISLLSCPILLESASKDPISKKFVTASVCAEGTLQVCCGKSGNYTEKPIATQSNESNRDFVMRNKLLPSKTYCGLQHTDDYFYNQTETSVDEFPWLVYMVISDKVDNYYLRKESNCVGVLISNQYVLTSFSDCYLLVEPRPGDFKYTIEMIFGQHHVYKDVSCIPTQFGVEDCTTPNIHEFAYEWYAAPTFHTQQLPSKFGLSILRLKNKINFSDFVRPICLPLDPNDLPKPGDLIATSGWGEEQSVDGKSVKLKKRIKYDMMDEEECANGNDVLNPICGVPWENNTYFVCPGDNGGPLMYKHGNSWYAAGILSKTKTCDDVHPVIAEGITQETLEWIFSAIVLFENRAKEDAKRGIK